MAAEKGKVDLKDLEKRLNEDPKLAEKFIKNPVATLKSEGITLSPAMARDLNSFIETSQTPTKAKAAKRGTVLAAPNISIMISIKIKF